MTDARNSTKPAILCVDKDPVAVAQYETALAAQYELTFVPSAVEAISVASR